MKIALLAPALIVSGACASSGEVSSDGVPGPGLKMVTDKEAPTTLLAVDGTICTVTPLRFQAIKVGDSATCEWRSRVEGPRIGGV